MIDEAIILIGHSGSGKSSYAAHLERTHGHKVFSWDKYCNYNLALNSLEVQTQIFTKIYEDLGENSKIVIDGFLHNATATTAFESVFKVKPVFHVLVVPIWLMIYRIAKKSENGIISPDLIYSAYFRDFPILYNYDECVFVRSTDYDFPKLPIKGKKQFAAYWEEINRYHSDEERTKVMDSVVKGKEYDNTYQSIEILDKQFEGHTKSHLSWNNIQCMTIWKDKRVLDIGTYHGYFAFKASGRGAKEVTGLEYHKDIFENTKRIRDAKQAPVGFLLGDAREKIWLPERDITIVMNVYHYFKTFQQFADNIFNNTNEVIFEMNKEDIEMMETQAWHRGFVLAPGAGMKTSHRIDSTTKTNRTYCKAVRYKGMGYV